MRGAHFDRQGWDGGEHHGGRGHGGHGGGGPGGGGGEEPDFEGLYTLSVTGTVTGSSNFAGEDVAGEAVTISWAINFSDPTIDTDGVYRRGYSNPNAPENGVIVSVRVGDLEQEDVIATTSTVSDRTASLTLYNNSPFVGNGGGDGMLGLVLGQIDADRSVVSDFEFTNHSGEMIDSLSLEQVLDLPIDGAFEGEGDDYADIRYLRQDLTQPGTVTHSLGVTPSRIQLNAIDPTELFEEDNLALIGFPVESGGSGCWWA